MWQGHEEKYHTNYYRKEETVMRFYQNLTGIIFFSGILLFAAVSSACGNVSPVTTEGKIGKIVTGELDKQVKAQMPVISSFGFDFPEVVPGDNATLKWNVKQAESVKVDNGLGEVEASGSRLLTPSADATYTLTASNKYGSVTGVAQIKLTDKVSPPLIIFTANTTSIQSGQTALLVWEVYRAREITIDSGAKVIVITDPKGYASVQPTTTTTYKLKASYGPAVSTKSVTIEVTPAGN
jgi:hypothetical protein